MDGLTSPQGSVALAVSALLLVVGYRLARPERAREWLGVAAYAAALVAQLLGARGVLPGPAPAAGAALRVAGAALLVTGLLVAGKPRARNRAAIEGDPPAGGRARAAGAVHAGLALVLLGQLMRAPSLAGAAAVSIAVAIEAWVAWSARRRGSPA
jgi:hypothetical protein